ncbi:MAG: serine/threonine-protein kinase, partial [Ktedonobacteraceae bacterium]
MKLWRYVTAIERLGNRYRLDGMLGSGGMADVCFAWDEREQREVAIKVIKEDNLDQKALDRFQKEASQVVGWNHPHILRFYDDLMLELLNAKNGSIVPYIVVEYAQGGDLHKRLRPNQPYPLKDALVLFEQLCSAVQYAHEHGVIHRDLKPLNILFRALPDGTEQAVLSDFGLAVQIDATHHTFANAGTLAYMAPEQLRGQSTPASDIFALGVILYQLCTGKLPFRRSLQDLRSTSFTEIPPLPSTVNPILPKALDEVILTALSEEQAKRFPTAAQFWEAVRIAIDATTMPGPILATGEEDDGPTETASRYSAKLAPSIKVPPIVKIEQSAMQAPNFVDVVPTPVENTGRLSQHESVIEHVPTAKLGEASPNSSIRYTHISQDSILDAPNNVNSQIMNSYRQNIVGQSQMVGAAAPGSKKIGGRLRTFQPRLLVVLALIVLAVIVIFAGVFYLVPGMFGTFTQSTFYSSGNTATIVPASQSSTGNFAILAVTGTPNSSQREVQARELSYTTPVQSKTVIATGVVNTPGTRATGTLTFYNASFAEYTVSAGTVIAGNSGVAIITNSPAYIPAAVFGGGYGATSVGAHAVNIGASGDIGTLDISKTCCGSGGVVAKNLGAFSGGQDPQHYTAVQQSDIDNVAKPLVNPTEQSALSSLKEQRHTNEELVGQP